MEGSNERTSAHGPTSWDGEPLFCADTVREGLFDPEAFAQIPGQLALDEPEPGDES